MVRRKWHLIGVGIVVPDRSSFEVDTHKVIVYRTSPLVKVLT